jgi:hypothetical protein
LRDAAKIEVVDPELKKAMDKDAAQGALPGADGDQPDDTGGQQ